MRTCTIVVSALLALSACAEGEGAGELSGATQGGDEATTRGEGGGAEGTQSGFQSADELGIALSPQSITFSPIPVGSSEEQLLEVLHTGSSGTLELSNVTYVAEEGADILLKEDFERRLEPGERVLLTLVYAPSDAGRERGQVRIETNAIDASGEALVVDVPVEASPLSSAFASDAMVVAFGGVATSTSETRALNVLNLGTLDLSIDALLIEGDSASEFSLPELSELPLILPAGESMAFNVSYSPEGQDTDTAILTIGASAEDAPRELIIPLSGHEISAELEISPDPLNFGLRSPGVAHVEVLTLRSNNPDVDVELSAIHLLETGMYSETISLGAFPDEGVVITHDAPYELEVSFTPSEEMLWGPDPLAELAFDSNDPSQAGTQKVPLYGQRQGSGLEVFPPDISYFGYVGVGASVTREVTLYNAGNEALNVEVLYTEGDYKILQGEGWGPTSNSATPATLEPGEIKVVRLSFTNSGPPLETTWGKLVILSDDALKPTWEVLLNAQKVEGGECLLQFVPSAVDFGMQPPWTQHTQSLTLVNIGSGPCTYRDAITDDCASEQSCQVSADAALADSTSERFTVSKQPEEGQSIAPGEMVSIEVTFHTPAAEPLITPYAAMLRARVTSLSGQSGEEVLSVHPSSESWLTIPNLHGALGVGVFELTPPELDFQLVEIGCVSPPTTIRGSNVGMAPLDVSDWWLEGCSDEVSVVSAPEAGTAHTLSVGQTLEWVFDYAPVDEATDTCALYIQSSDTQTPTLVPVSGEGDYPAQLVDVFTDSEAQKVDVLFVVDDSGSMSEEQGNLSDSFEAFIFEAASWDSDYRIAVTTTTISLFELSGGALFGSPPWVTEDNWEKFVNIVEVGTSGSGDEQGIWAAYIATSSPATDPPEGSCEIDTDCGLNRVCHEQACQGINYGFFREDAALEVVFVSDEEDNSPEELDAYLNHFRAIKGYEHPELLHMHAIVGPPGGCSSANGSAQAGHRYMNMADATGGAIYSICELDFAKGLEGIGEIAFASKMEYQLTQTPAPTTITVTIEGLPCPALTGGVFNWVYDAEDNTLTLTEEGICIAGSGDEVIISYDLLCYAEAD